MVVKGVGKHLGSSFATWLEGGKIPCVVFELAMVRHCGEGTWRNDVGAKKDLYEELGVKECFFFDPQGDLLPEPLMGYRLKKGLYQELRPRNGRLWSAELGFELAMSTGGLRLFERGAAEPLPTRAQRAARAEARAEAECQEKERERRRAEVAEAESQRLMAELERLRRMIEVGGKEATDAGETPADPGS